MRQQQTKETVHSEGNYQQKEKAPYEWENLFANDMPKRLIYKLYKECIQLNIKKKSDSEMSKGSEFFQGRYIDGQQTHEKMFNIIHYQGNANYNHEILPHTCQNDSYQKDTNKKCWQEWGKKGTVGGIANWCSN